MSDWFQLVRRGGAAAVPALAKLPDVNIRNSDEENLLHAAIAYSNTECALELVRLGIDVNAQNVKGLTPLHYAAAHKNAVVARKLLERGADPGIVDEHGNSALWTAVASAKGEYEVAKILIEAGGRKLCDQKNNHGRSPLDFARQIRDAHLVELIAGES
jgi:ankyrin repeat protein